MILERVNPVGVGRSLRIPLRIATLFGAFGGFLYAYQNSSCKDTTTTLDTCQFQYA